MGARYHFASVDSTSTRADELTRAGERPPFWVTADRQLGGRGRLGRRWVSEVGNLYASHALVARKPVATLPQLSIVLGLAAARAIEEAAGARVRLKWPNDLMLDGHKIGGLLLDLRNVGETVVIAGFGINCAHHPRDVRYPASDLASLGHPVEPVGLFEALRPSVATALEEWHSNGFCAFRTQWLARAHGMGDRIGIATGDERIEGTVEGMDEEGRLVLREGSARRVVSAGDWLPPDAGGPHAASGCLTSGGQGLE